MRGVQFSILIVFWLIAVGIVMAASWNLPFMGGSGNTAVVKTDVYMMDSAIDAATTYIQTAVQFSNYQACYDLMKKGGDVPERAEFEKSFKSELLKDINIYMEKGYGFATKYNVDLPGFDSVSLSENAGSAEVSAAAVGDMVSFRESSGNTGFTSEVTLTRSAGFSGVKLRMDCMSYYDKMKAASDDMRKKISDAITAERGRLLSADGIEMGESLCQTLITEAENNVRSAITGSATLSLAGETMALPATTGKISWFASDAGDSCKTQSESKTGKCLAQQTGCPSDRVANPGAWNDCLGESYGVVWYAAMRWPVAEKSSWYNKKILVTNPANGKSVVLEIKDFGPAESTGRVIDVSKTALAALGANTDDVVNIAFADENAQLGLVSGTAAPATQPASQMPMQPGTEIKSLNLGVAFDMSEKDPATGIYTCKFKPEGEAGAEVLVRMDSAEKFPVDNGQKIKYEPISAVFDVTATA
jgi:hypothetical protein